MIRLRWIQILLIVLPLLLAIMTIGAAVQIYSRKSIEELRTALLEQNGEAVTLYLEALFDDGLDIMREIENRARIGSIDLETGDWLVSNYAERLRIHENLAWISFSQASDGSFQGLWRGENGQVFINTSSPEINNGRPTEQIVYMDGSMAGIDRNIEAGYDPRQRAWYRTAVERRELAWSSIFEFNEGRMGITASKPYYTADSGELIGVITVDYFIENLQHFLDRIKIGATGYALIYNRDGSLIIPSFFDDDTYEFLGQRMTNISKLSISQNGLVAPERIDEFTRGGKHSLSVLPLLMEKNRHWYAGFVMRDDEFMGVIDVNRRILLVITLCVVVLGITLGVIFSNRLASRIHAIVEELRNIQAGREPAFDRVKTRILEVNLLRKTADQMHRDLKEMERNKEERIVAETRSRIKGHVMRMVAHDMNQPVHIITLSAEALTEQASTLNGNQLEALRSIEISCNDLQQLSVNLSFMGRLECARLKLKVEDFDLRELLKESLHVLSMQGKYKGVVIQAELDPAVGIIRNDRLRIKQILNNILHNAIKFTDAGSIAVVMQKTGEQCVITITDTGIGMTPEELERIFEPYEQANAEIARKFGGTGLGLNIAKGLGNGIGIDLKVESTPGVGSRFTVTVPLTPLEATSISLIDQEAIFEASSSSL